MKNIIPLLLLALMTSCAESNQQIVKNYTKAYNKFDFEKAVSYLDTSYVETFVDGTIEVADLDQLRDFMSWREVMESNTEIIEIAESGDTVITTEETSNMMDRILERRPRSFKIKHLFADGKIKQTIIDTMPGYLETAEFNYNKLEAFQIFCDSMNFDFGYEMNAEAAAKIKEALKAYKDTQSK